MRDLKLKAEKLREHIIEMLTESGSGHPGGSLSLADIMSCLYFKHLNIDPKKPHWEDRDRFILSKGHACPVFYAALAEKGYFSTDELMKLRKLGSILQGHPSMRKTPGVDISSGSLGQGMSVGCGMAKAAKFLNKDNKVYCIIGDGELDEGQNYEAMMLAAQYKLDNLCVILDHNGLQIDGKNEDIMDIRDISQKFRVFGFHVEDIDGHNMEEIDKTIQKFKENKGKPFAIIAKTIKGKGVSFMENDYTWHGKTPSKEQKDIALAEIHKRMEEI